MTLLAVAGATALLLLDVTVVYVALPSVRDDLGASFAELQWVVDAYALALAATLLSAGALADRFGRRRVFLAGLWVFTAASLGCAAAADPLVLDLARGVQGLGGAAIFSASLAILAHEYRGEERGRALGIWGAVTGAALAGGPVVGGALVDWLGWRSIFLLNLPVGAALIWLTWRSVPESADPDPRRLDRAGIVLFTVGCFALIDGLIRREWAPGLLGAAVLVGFVVWEARASAPMLDLSLFRIPAFSATAAVAFAQSLALYPMFLFVAVYFQEVLGHGPLRTGLELLPATIPLLLVAPLSGRLAGRVRLGIPLAAGLTLIGISLLLLRRVGTGEEWTALLPGLLVGGLGIGVISPALAAAMVAVVSPERFGLASGLNNTFRQLGIAVGIAGLGALLDARAADGDFIGGLDVVFLISALVALAAVPVALAGVRVRTG